jgi:hypothetical protein
METATRLPAYWAGAQWPHIVELRTGFEPVLSEYKTLVLPLTPAKLDG